MTIATDGSLPCRALPSHLAGCLPYFLPDYRTLLNEARRSEDAMIGELGPISHKIQYQITFKSAEATRLLYRKLEDCQCQFLTNLGVIYMNL